MQMTPQFNESNTDLRNQLASIGALESSTASNALAKNYDNFVNTLAVQAGSAGLAQTMQALENRITLSNYGLNALSQASQQGGASESRLNQFNLQNYENQFARQVYEDQNKAGGWLGALKGGIGGGVLGTGLAVAAAPFTGGASLAYIPAALGAGALGGGLLGGFSNQATQNSLLQGGISMAPMAMSSAGSLSANRTATNNMFRTPLNLDTSLKITPFADRARELLYGGLYNERP